MRALKILVVFLGVLLVGGTAAMVAAVLYRVNHRPAAPQEAARPAGGRGFDHATIDLPEGARVLSVDASGERLVIRLALAQGGEALLLVDPKTGARLGTIELRPGGPGKP